MHLKPETPARVVAAPTIRWEMRLPSDRLPLAPALTRTLTRTHRQREAISSRRAAGVAVVETHTSGIDHTRGRRIARTRTRHEGLKAKLAGSLLAA